MSRAIVFLGLLAYLAHASDLVKRNNGEACVACVQTVYVTEYVCANPTPAIGGLVYADSGKDEPQNYPVYASVTPDVTTVWNGVPTAQPIIPANPTKPTTTAAVPAGTPSAAVVPVPGQCTALPSFNPNQHLHNEDFFISAVLEQHNAYRAQYNTAPLTWNQGLADEAYSWAQQCRFASSGTNNGENRGMSTYNNLEYIIFRWYDEYSLYDFSKGQYAENTGHFTQIVWEGTTQVGCGWVHDCGATAIYPHHLVCHYSPPGNVIGQFLDNVHTALYPTASVCTPAKRI